MVPHLYVDNDELMINYVENSDMTMACASARAGGLTTLPDSIDISKRGR